MRSDLDTGEFRVEPGSALRLSEHDAAWMGTPQMRQLDADELKDEARSYVANRIQEFSEAQELLYADNRYSVLLLFQGMDAAGKDGTIKHVTAGVNPAGFQVSNFKQPSAEELDHNFLWRYWKAMPERGRIGIFNRSYYEDVTTVRVHPERGHLSFNEHPVDLTFWNERLEDINNLERHLSRNGTLIIKFFLNVSKEEQKRRLMKRLEDPEKHWKFDASDVVERGYWDDYAAAFEAALSATSTAWAPWYVVPADHKWVMRALVASIITGHIGAMHLAYPEQDEARHKLLKKSLAQLTDERKPGKRNKKTGGSHP